MCVQETSLTDSLIMISLLAVVLEDGVQDLS